MDYIFDTTSVLKNKDITFGHHQESTIQSEFENKKRTKRNKNEKNKKRWKIIKISQKMNK